jgi:hypothetical protein
MYTYLKPIRGLSSIRSISFLESVCNYEKTLFANGYKPHVVRSYTAAGLRDFLAKQYRHYGRNSIRMVLAAVRMFLRYLALDGRCRAGLEQALLSPAKWS